MMLIFVVLMFVVVWGNCGSGFFMLLVVMV